MSAIVSFEDLEPQEVRLTWRGRTFVLREPTEGQYARYENAIAQATRYDPETGKRVGHSNLGDADAVLVAACMTEERTGSEHRIEEEEVRAMPHRIVGWAFQWLRERTDAGPKDVPGKS